MNDFKLVEHLFKPGFLDVVEMYKPINYHQLLDQYNIQDELIEQITTSSGDIISISRITPFTNIEQFKEEFRLPENRNSIIVFHLYSFDISASGVAVVPEEDLDSFLSFINN